MGKVNVHLQYVFLFFNALFHVIGWLTIFGAVGYFTIWLFTESTVIAWFGVIGVICISALGMYAGYKEHAPALKIFEGCVAVGMVVTLIFGIIVIVERQQYIASFDHYTVVFLDTIYYQKKIGMLFGLFAAAMLNLGMSITMIRQIEGTASFPLSLCTVVGQSSSQ